MGIRGETVTDVSQRLLAHHGGLRGLFRMDKAVLVEIKEYEAAGDFANPRYMELLVEQHYVHHVLRMPAAEWPDPVNRAFTHMNPSIYVPLQGPSELG